MTQFDFHRILDKTYEHLWNGRYKLAFANAKKLFLNYPNNSEATIVLAWALLENGYPIKALEYADIALQLNGSSTKARLIRAQILLRLNILEGAKEDFEFSINNQKKFLGASYLELAKVEASKGDLLKALQTAEKAFVVNSHLKEEVKELNELLLLSIEFKSNKIKLTPQNLQQYFDRATNALKNKNIWFVNILAEKILSDKKLSEFFPDAEMIKLEGLLHSFQFKPALERAELLKNKLSGNKQFNVIYNKIQKKKLAQEKISYELEEEFKLTKNNKILVKSTVETDLTNNTTEHSFKTDAAFYKNKLVDVFSLKIFNQTEEETNGKRTYYEELALSNLDKIGLEIIFENLEFEKSENEYNATAVWYLNDFEVDKTTFKLQVPIDWDTVIFTQTGNAQWSFGQGRVELYIEGFKVCEKWFIVGENNIKLTPKQEVDAVEKNDEIVPPSDEENATPIPSRSIDELLEELDGFVGLKTIKHSVKEFIDYLKFQKEREKKGLHGGKKFSINAVFEGNPGTGKTTIARLLGEIFRAIGIVDKGHIVEVDRSSLVGQYVGETAQKTEKLIQEAMGGILFIDEAYTLVKKGGSGQDFGQEAIDILLKRMEDKKGEFVVIAAGYPKEMDEFINSNPGLKSRFNHVFTFDDYSPDELLQIFENAIAKEDYKINDDAKGELKKEFTRLYRKRDASFGNARLIMQIFEKLKIQISKRLVKLSEEEKTTEVLSTFILEDVKNILNKKSAQDVQLPIDQEALSEALSELNNLFGLQSIKDEVENLVKLVKYFIKQGVNVRDKFGDHILFLGNPGTGKTTVARIISNIYSALGILPTGQLIEVDRSGLVGSHVGETAQKTTLVVGSAMGGTLFIDEAYALSAGGSNDFGKEAIDTLLKRMEDDRGKFLVIAAGYTNEMKEFIESNPGMKSRFTKTFFFDDYTPDELMKIAKLSLTKMNLQIEPDAEELLLKHFNIIYSKRDRHFGNARIVRNLLEKIKKKYLLRLADNPDENTNKKIILDDVKGFVEKQNIAKKFTQKKTDNLQIILNNLNHLVGHENVKKQIEKQIKTLKISKLRAERGLKSINKNLNSLFIGNRGTSKSTIANYLGKIYKELNYLKSGHVVEVKGNELLFVDKEQAQNRLEAYVNKALGGILFIEELSVLFNNSDLKKLVLDNLTELYEKYFGEFVLIISGDRISMEMFSSDDSIKLKFNDTFIFDDYTPRELLKITVDLASENNYVLDEGALQIIHDLYIRANEIENRKYQNIRLAEQILFKAISNQEERISMIYNLKDEFLTTIIYDDVASIQLEEL